MSFSTSFTNVWNFDWSNDHVVNRRSSAYARSVHYMIQSDWFDQYDQFILIRTDQSDPVDLIISYMITRLTDLMDLNWSYLMMDADMVLM